MGLREGEANRIEPIENMRANFCGRIGSKGRNVNALQDHVASAQLIGVNK
jgi:hypothetical protein